MSAAFWIFAVLAVLLALGAFDVRIGRKNDAASDALKLRYGGGFRAGYSDDERAA